MLVVALLLSAYFYSGLTLAQGNGSDPNSPKRIVGFIENSFIKTDSSGFQLSNIDPKQYNVIKYAFVNITENFECTFGQPDIDTQFWAPDADRNCDCCARGALNDLFNMKRKFPHLRNVLTVGGWTWSRYFSPAASTDANRKKLASSCTQMVIDYGMDGIDIDWEYPGAKNGQNINTNNIESPADTDNLVLLFQEFRNQFSQYEKNGKKFILTLDIASQPYFYASGSQLQALSKVVDWFNVMDYEYALSNAKSPSHNSNLMASKLANGLSVDESTKALIKAGVPPAQIVIGTVLFGRHFSNAAGGTNGLYGTASGQNTIYWKDLRKLLGNPDLKTFFDDQAQASYAYNAKTQDWYTYEGPEDAKRKMKYINQMGLGGTMLWEVAYDSFDAPDSTISKAIAESLTNVMMDADKNIFQPASKFCNIRGDRSSSKNHASAGSRFSPALCVLSAIGALILSLLN